MIKIFMVIGKLLLLHKNIKSFFRTHNANLKINRKLILITILMMDNY